MSEAKTRYHRGVEVVNHMVRPLTRYERFDRVLTTVIKEVRSGSELRAEALGKRIQISLGKKGTWIFPTLESGLRSIGDILEGNIGSVSTIDGECPGTDPIDQELLNGSFLIVSAFGDKMKVCWIRTLPALVLEVKSGSHLVSQRGVKTLVREATSLLTLISEAIGVTERVDKVSTLAHKSVILR
jgi:hypothetical protein